MVFEVATYFLQVSGATTVTTDDCSDCSGPKSGTSAILDCARDSRRIGFDMERLKEMSLIFALVLMLLQF